VGAVAAVNNITYRFAGQYCTVYIPVQGEIAKIIPVSYGGFPAASITENK
jgi:hypothetical protein